LYPANIVWLTTSLLLACLAQASAQTPDSLFFENLIALPNAPQGRFDEGARELLLRKLELGDRGDVAGLIRFVDHRRRTDTLPWISGTERLLAEVLTGEFGVVGEEGRLSSLLAGSYRRSGATGDDRLLTRERELLRYGLEQVQREFDLLAPGEQDVRFFEVLLNHLLVSGYRGRSRLNDMVDAFAAKYPATWQAALARRYIWQPYSESEFGAAFSAGYGAGWFDRSLGTAFDYFHGPALVAEFYLYRVTLAGMMNIGVAGAPEPFVAGGRNWQRGKSSFINGSLDLGYEIRMGRIGITPLVGLALQSVRGPGDESVPESLPRTGNRLGLDAALVLGYRIPFDVGPSLDLRIRFGRTMAGLGDYDPRFSGALYSVQLAFALVQRPYRSRL
jgi:hypothetical protein